jgi:MraZ protein
MLGFYGTFERSIDPKGRLILPPRLRSQLASAESPTDPDAPFSVFLSLGVDNCIDLYGASGWQERVDRLNKRQNAKNRDYIRLLFANTDRQVPDSQGRITIPDNLLQYAAIGNESEKDREITINGALSRFEIWSRRRWDKLSSVDLAGDVISRHANCEFGEEDE